MRAPEQRICCLIIDDEAPARRIVAKFLADMPAFEIAAECRNAFEAMEAIKAHNPQLIFLDINMPKLSGLKMLAALTNPPLVIVTTAYREYAVEGFELNVVDYLHKPFSQTRFIQALNKVEQRLVADHLGPVDLQHSTQSDPGFIFIKHAGEMIRLDVQAIEYVEAVGDYVQVVTNSKKYLSYLSMKKCMALLTDHHFFRVHKSFIVNLSRIRSISGNMLFLKSRSIPIGGSYRGAFMETLKTFMP